MNQVTKIENKTDTAVAVVTPMVLLQQAVESGADIEKLEKLMDLQERYENREAEKAFNVAMSQFKANAPKIIKDVDVAYGNTAYSHAKLSKAAALISDEMANHGLSFTWETHQDSAIIEVTCKIIHILGHSQSVSLKSAADTSGGKNTIQAIGSAVSYLQRYTLLSAVGIAASDQDDDGIGSEPKEIQLIGDDDVMTIAKAADEKGVKIDTICKAYNVASIADLPLDQFSSVMNKIKATKAKK